MHAVSVFYELLLIVLSVLTIWCIQVLTIRYYFAKVFYHIDKRRLGIFIVSFLVSVFYVYATIHGYSVLASIIFWCMIVFELNKSCTIRFQACILSAGIVSFNLIIIRNLVLSAMTVIFKQNFQTILSMSSLHQAFIVFLCSFFSLILFFIGQYIDPETQSESRRKSPEISSATLFGITLFNVYLLFCTLMAEIGLIVPEALLFYVGSNVWLLIIGLVLLAYESQNYRNRKSKIDSEHFNEQLKRQIQYYQSYKDYTESLRNFRYDYKQKMTTVTHLMAENRMEEARKLILSINDDMSSKIDVHQEYSNDVLMDALLQDVANRCKDEQITFKAKLYIPKGVNLDEKGFCHVFTILCETGIENNLEINDNRKLNISTMLKGSWLNITMVYPKGEERSLAIIGQEIQNSGGFLNVEIEDEMQNIFIHLPILKEKFT